MTKTEAILEVAAELNANNGFARGFIAGCDDDAVVVFGVGEGDDAEGCAETIRERLSLTLPYACQFSFTVEGCRVTFTEKNGRLH